MLFGRILGWSLLVLTVILASADAVLALGPADYAGILTADVLTLLTGGAPGGDGGFSLLATAEATLLAMPVWVLPGIIATAMLVGCRKRAKRHRFRRV